MDWHLLTALGSATLVWPCALLLGLLLWLTQARPGGVLRWWLAFAAANALVATSKLLFYAWGTGWPAWNLTSFSGHATLAAAFWPVALAAALRGSATGRVVGVMGGLAMALAVAQSRVELGAHPPSEAVAGWLLGLAAALPGLWSLGRPPAKPPHARWTGWAGWAGWSKRPGSGMAGGLGSGAPVGGLVAMALLLCSLQTLPTLPTERWLQRLAVALSGKDRPMDRQQWRAVPTARLPASGALAWGG